MSGIVDPDAVLGALALGLLLSQGGGARGIVGFGTIGGADTRFHEGGQPLNVQAGRCLLFATLCVLDLSPPRLAPFVNRQPYNESNSPLCSFLTQDGRERFRVLYLSHHGFPCFRQGCLGLGPCLALLFNLCLSSCQDFLGFGQRLFRFWSGLLLVFGPGCFGLGSGFFNLNLLT
jgi:hypothetical protein